MSSLQDNLAASLAAPMAESDDMVTKLISFRADFLGVCVLRHLTKPGLIKCQLLKTLPVQTMGKPFGALSKRL